MRKVICLLLLFVFSLTVISQAVIVKFEAEDEKVYYVPGANWETVDDENASNGKYITAIENSVAFVEANTRYYSFNMPAGTYVLYVRLSIDTISQGAADNDSFFLSQNSLSEDAAMIDYNGIDQTDIDGVSTLLNFGWVPVHASYGTDIRTYVMGADGIAYFKAAPRENGLFVDAFAFVTQGEEVTGEQLDSILPGGPEPYDPVVTPEWEDGSVGTLISETQAQVTLHFKAAGDPAYLDGYRVNPAIEGHYIYISNGGAADPNVYLLDYVEQVHNPDPNLTDPNVAYGPMTLSRGIVYYWQVEEAMSYGSGNAGDPNNILGPVWTFTTISTKPKILVDPEHVLADFSGNASFSVTAGPAPVVTNVYYRWYKVGDPNPLSGGIYSGEGTATLTITGATANDEGEYYCIAYNGDPDAGGIASDPSAAAWLWYPRLVNHYEFETMDNGVTPDSESGYDMQMKSNDTGTDVPVLDTNVVSGITGTKSLKFNNPRGTDPSTADAQYAQISEGWAGGYKDITISAWVYSSGGSNWNRILDYGNNNSNYMFICVNTGSVNGAVRFAVNLNGSEQSVTSPAGALPDHEWTYITATLKDNTGRIYINGELAGTNTGLTNDPVSYGPTTQNWIGRSQWGEGDDGYFNGMLDELKIYNYARTTEEVGKDYLAVKGGWVCNQELKDLPYDFDGNCKVDLADLAILAATWLDSYRIYPAE